MKHPDDHQGICELVKDAITPSSRRGERDTEYRRRILSAARMLLESNDIESVTMHQIAKESGVGQGTLYRRYTHIGDVCSDLIKSTTTRFIDMLEAKYTKADPEGSGLAQLSACIHDVIDFVDENVSLLSVISSMHADKRSVSIHKKPFFTRLRNILAPLIQHAIQNGEIKDLDVTLTVNTLLISLFPEQYLYHKDVLGYTKQQFTEGICRLFVKGI
ncbi:TetR/AcrR family transcriptional regulator [Paenibacillus qinlingensis]|uniref:TetR/AcrR family transcriptional regulator n=1 Tax=Paenibacillus qinlingensis TaxID=1837343 RepID=UPI0015678FCB|nr:TetR/AcrR family transcriptional regulator [Paenibacillus qinlingensis]NQX57905.1 TetR/AcrR family transcriptional regulator [Paenibacillus qinlingensis]